MVELEPLPEEDDIAEREFGSDLESHGLVEVMADMTRFDSARLRKLLANHARYTGSVRARTILDDWPHYRTRFKKVMPVEYRRALAEMAKSSLQAAE
jgi:glutamate synthase (NADPH/NADH) large chain